MSLFTVILFFPRCGFSSPLIFSLVSGFWFLVCGLRFLVSGFWFVVSGFWPQVSGRCPCLHYGFGYCCYQCYCRCNCHCFQPLLLPLLLPVLLPALSPLLLPLLLPETTVDFPDFPPILLITPERPIRGSNIPNRGSSVGHPGHLGSSGGPSRGHPGVMQGSCRGHFRVTLGAL